MVISLHLQNYEAFYFFHDGCIVRDGVRGGTSGTIHCSLHMGAE